jgi:hypothetical protein
LAQYFPDHTHDSSVQLLQHYNSGRFSRDVLYYVTKAEILTKIKETGYFIEKFTVRLYYWTKIFVTKALKK